MEERRKTLEEILENYEEFEVSELEKLVHFCVRMEVKEIESSPVKAG